MYYTFFELSSQSSRMVFLPDLHNISLGGSLLLQLEASEVRNSSKKYYASCQRKEKKVFYVVECELIRRRVVIVEQENKTWKFVGES